MATSGWIGDEDRNDCTKCHAEFTFFNRRHHCRGCGRIFCNSCSKWRQVVEDHEGPQRTCQECFKRLNKKAEWEGPAAQMMKQGHDAKEYYSVYSPADRHLSLSVDCETLMLKDSNGAVKSSLAVKNIINIHQGNHTRILQSNNVDPNCSLVIESSSATFNLGFRDNKIREAWARGLRTRIEFENMASPEELMEKERQTLAKRQIEQERAQKRSKRNNMRDKYGIKNN